MFDYLAYFYKVCQVLAVCQIRSVSVHYLLCYRHYDVKPCYIDENGHCACAVSRDLYVGARNNQKFGNLDPDLPLHYTTFKGLQ